MNHIESQWHDKFSNCLRLLFLIFDQWQRHATCQAVKATVHTTKLAMDTFSQIVAEPSFLGKLEKSKNNPNDPESQMLLAKLSPHVSLVNFVFSSCKICHYGTYHEYWCNFSDHLQFSIPSLQTTSAVC
jgi:hypothetical protein